MKENYGKILQFTPKPVALGLVRDLVTIRKGLTTSAIVGLASSGTTIALSVYIATPPQLLPTSFLPHYSLDGFHISTGFTCFKELYISDRGSDAQTGVATRGNPGIVSAFMQCRGMNLGFVGVRARTSDEITSVIFSGWASSVKWNVIYFPLFPC